MNTRFLISVIGIGALFSGATDRAGAATVPFTNLPTDAKVAIALSVRGGELGDIEEQHDGDQVVYEATINRAGVKQKIRVAQDGKVLGAAAAGGNEKAAGEDQGGAKGAGMQGGAKGAGVQGGAKGAGVQGGAKGAGVQGGAAAGGLPPGIAMKQGGFLPPGLAKKAARGEELPPPWRNGTFMPPGLAKKNGAGPGHGPGQKNKPKDPKADAPPPAAPKPAPQQPAAPKPAPQQQMEQPDNAPHPGKKKKQGGPPAGQQNDDPTAAPDSPKLDKFHRPIPQAQAEVPPGQPKKKKKGDDDRD